MADKKDKDLTTDSYNQQMATTIANQQKQLDALSQQMYPGKGANLTAENSNMIQTNQYSTPVVDGGISGRDYYSTTPSAFVAPNMEGRQRAAASNLRDYTAVANFKDNFDSYISSIKNIPGVNDEVYNNLVNKAYGAINQLADVKDLENYDRYVKEIASNIGGDWGGNALNASYTDYSDKKKNIEGKAKSFDATKTGGYSPEQVEYANTHLNNSFKGVTLNPETGKVEYTSFQAPDLIEYQNVTHQVEELLKNWESDGTLGRNKDNTLKLLRDIPGSAGIVSKESVSEKDLRNLALKYLQSGGLGPYMEQQATITATNTLNRLAAAQAQGVNPETMLASMVNNFKGNYNNPLETTNMMINGKGGIDDLIKSGKTYSEVLLGNNAFVLKELMRSKFEDDTIGLPTSKYSFSKETYNNYSDAKEQAEWRIYEQEQLRARGLGSYAPDNEGSGGSGSGSSSDFSEGAETFAISILTDKFHFNESYTIDSLNTFSKQATDSYTKANNSYLDIKRKIAQKDKNTSVEALENAEAELKRADDEVRYFKEIQKNITANTSKVLEAQGFKIKDKFINKESSKLNYGIESEGEFNKFITELSGVITAGNYSNIYRTSEYLDLLDKYKISTKGSGSGNTVANRVDFLAKSLNNAIKKLPDSDKSLLLSPQVDIKYILSEGSNSKNTALNAFEASYKINSKKLKESPNTFRALDTKGNPVNFLEAAASYMNASVEEVADVIKWDDTTMYPTVQKDYIMSKKLGNGMQYLATVKLNTDSEFYKKNKDKFKDIRKNGNLKMLITTDQQNADTSNRENNLRIETLFKDVASRGSSAHSAEVIRTIGLAWANTNNYSKDFNKYTFYDLDPSDPQSNREVNVNGSKYLVGAIYTDPLTKNLTDKDFYIRRKNPDKQDTGFYNQYLVTDNTTGQTKWVDVNEINAQGGMAKSKLYSRAIGNTPNDLLGFLATTDLYEGLAREAYSKSNSKAKGGSLRGASTYNMNPDYRRAASIIRQVESSNNYSLVGDIAVGAYQVVPSQHSSTIKSLYNMNMEQFRKSPEAQDKYFEYMINETNKALNGSDRVKLLNIIRTANPKATYDDAIAAVHFWGINNIRKLIKGEKGIEDKIPYKKNGVTKYNPSLGYHLRKIRKAY